MSAEHQRLDQALGLKYPGLSRSTIKKLIIGGYVRINDKVIKKPSFSVEGQQNLEIITDVLNKEPESVDIDVIYEDSDLIVIDKPEGLLAHSKGVFNAEPTVVTWLFSLKNFKFDKDNNRAGIVHRLDRATSGVMVCAKNKSTLGFLQKQFQFRKVKKTYIAIVDGHLKQKEALIDLPIERNPKKPQTFKVGSNGKKAETKYKAIKQCDKYSMVELKPLTGRTHQLRVHLSHLKNPIAGDIFYNGSVAERLFLHASELELTLPSKERRVFKAPLSQEFNHKCRH